MSLLQITDNHDWKDYKSFFTDNVATDEDLLNLQKIADVRIKDLSFENNPNLLVFPRDFSHYGDKIGDDKILSLNHRKEISTSSIMGFVGINDTQIDIKSRFAKNDEEDYFLHYMLQKVFSINFFDIKHSSCTESIFDFLIYMFPYFLKKALTQGLFKKYQKYEYNDSNLKGNININRHITQNIPFRGNISYSTREHSYDNEMTQLIRHTIEFIKTKNNSSFILNNDKETKEYVAQITMATSSYNHRERNKIINKNLRLIQHPYYLEYTALQKICLQILRHETIKFGKEKDKVYGILFDGAWLWEEYLNTILEKYGFKHPKNRESYGGFRMFEKPEEDKLLDNNSRRLYPDFYKDDFIIDAKYKHLENGVGREDLYQLVTYMYCKKAKNGAYVYPCKNKDIKCFEHQLSGYGGHISVIPFYIPQSAECYEQFKEKIFEFEDNIML
ncbi:MAG: hypothetical protein IJZ87_10280 [Bacteroidales bacterium]|nr:hypothetical protein [Bacteroidales bacterium]